MPSCPWRTQSVWAKIGEYFQYRGPKALPRLSVYTDHMTLVPSLMGVRAHTMESLRHRIQVQTNSTHSLLHTTKFPWSQPPQYIQVQMAIVFIINHCLKQESWPKPSFILSSLTSNHCWPFMVNYLLVPRKPHSHHVLWDSAKAVLRPGNPLSMTPFLSWYFLLSLCYALGMPACQCGFPEQQVAVYI